MISISSRKLYICVGASLTHSRVLRQFHFPLRIYKFLRLDSETLQRNKVTFAFHNKICRCIYVTRGFPLPPSLCLCCCTKTNIQVLTSASDSLSQFSLKPDVSAAKLTSNTTNHIFKTCKLNCVCHNVQVLQKRLPACVLQNWKWMTMDEQTAVILDTHQILKILNLHI